MTLPFPLLPWQIKNYIHVFTIKVCSVMNIHSTMIGLCTKFNLNRQNCNQTKTKISTRKIVSFTIFHFEMEVAIKSGLQSDCM